MREYKYWEIRSKDFIFFLSFLDVIFVADTRFCQIIYAQKEEVRKGKSSRHKEFVWHTNFDALKYVVFRDGQSTGSILKQNFKIANQN